MISIKRKNLFTIFTLLEEDWSEILSYLIPAPLEIWATKMSSLCIQRFYLGVDERVYQTSSFIHI